LPTQTLQFRFIILDFSFVCFLVNLVC
jgi:hypothetical protein